MDAEELMELGSEALDLGFTDTARHGLQCARDHIEKTNGAEDNCLARQRNLVFSTR